MPYDHLLKQSRRHSPQAYAADAGARYGDGEMGLSGPGAADQDQVALVFEEAATAQFAHQRLVDRRSIEVELVDLLGEGQPGDGHLVFDRPRLLLADLGIEKVADDLLRLVLPLHRDAYCRWPAASPRGSLPHRTLGAVPEWLTGLILWHRCGR